MSPLTTQIGTSVCLVSPTHTKPLRAPLVYRPFFIVRSPPVTHYRYKSPVPARCCRVCASFCLCKTCSGIAQTRMGLNLNSPGAPDEPSRRHHHRAHFSSWHTFVAVNFFPPMQLLETTNQTRMPLLHSGVHVCRELRHRTRRTIFGPASSGMRYWKRLKTRSSWLACRSPGRSRG